MGTSPSPRTHSSSGAASAAGEGRKGCLFLKMPFTIQAPSTWFYSAASYTRHQTRSRLLCAESFPHGESYLDLPCVFQSISPVRHTDKLKQADFDRAQKENGGGSARRGRAASPRSPPFPVEIGKVAAFPAPGVGVFFPIVTHQPRYEGAGAWQGGGNSSHWWRGGEVMGSCTTGLQARVGTLLLM